MKEDNPMPNVPIPTTTWKRKEISHNENFQIALVTKECNEEDECFIDSGCSSHMTGDQSKFVSLKKKGDLKMECTCLRVQGIHFP